MFKKILIIAGLLLVGTVLIKSSVADTAVANKENQNLLMTKEEQELSTLNRVTEKIHEKYVGVDVKTTSKKELRIIVVGDEEYFNSVKNDMESIAKSVIKSSQLKDHKIVFERWDLLGIPKEFNKDINESHHLAKLLIESLKDYEVVLNININHQKSITIHTSIKSSDKDVHKLTKKIEETVSKILHSKELNSVSHIDSYEIKIVDSNGHIIN